jgi:Mg2+/citrate symporter
MFAPHINSIKNTFIVPNDAHYYKITEMLKESVVQAWGEPHACITD